jgi:hypothetical protein
MSHTVEVPSIVFSDMDALGAAIKELNAAGVKCSLQKGGTPRAFYDNQEGMGAADYVVKLEDARYDIGLYYDTAKKGYVARTDLFGGTVAKVMGATARPGESAEQAALGRLYQGYGVHAATRAAVKNGYTVRRIVKDDGSIALHMTGMRGS